jgi:hypothetical protein
MKTAPTIKYAGGYNGDRYSVAGYFVSDDNYYFIKSDNSITAKVTPCIDNNAKNYLTHFNVSISRNNEIILSYVYTLDKSMAGNNHLSSLVDNISINILFQLDELELDKLLPMIKNSKKHSFSLDRKINTYYIYCQSEHPEIDEFIIHKFNNKFHFDECSLYRENMSVNKVIRDYSHFTYSSLCHSLSDDDKMLTLSGTYSTWCMVFDSKMNVINYIIEKKIPFTMEENKEENTLQVKNVDDFYDTAFGMIFSHILSSDFIINSMSSIIDDYDIDPKQHWRDFIHLFDMATI